MVIPRYAKLVKMKKIKTHFSQGCAQRKIEGSPVLWACEIWGAQHMICMKEVWFSVRPRAKVRHQGSPGAAGEEPFILKEHHCY